MAGSFGWFESADNLPPLDEGRATVAEEIDGLKRHCVWCPEKNR
jgi:hypothetical protein